MDPHTHGIVLRRNMIFPCGDPHMDIHMGIPTGENHIPIPIPFPWVWGSIWGFPYPQQPWIDQGDPINLSIPKRLNREHKLI